MRTFTVVRQPLNIDQALSDFHNIRFSCFHSLFHSEVVSKVLLLYETLRYHILACCIFNNITVSAFCFLVSFIYRRSFHVLRFHDLDWSSFYHCCGGRCWVFQVGILANVTFTIQELNPHVTPLRPHLAIFICKCSPMVQGRTHFTRIPEPWLKHYVFDSPEWSDRKQWHTICTCFTR